MLRYSAESLVSRIKFLIQKLRSNESARVESQHFFSHPVNLGDYLSGIPSREILSVESIGEGIPPVISPDVDGGEVPLFFVSLFLRVVASGYREVVEVLDA